MELFTTAVFARWRLVKFQPTHLVLPQCELEPTNLRPTNANSHDLIVGHQSVGPVQIIIIENSLNAKGEKKSMLTKFICAGAQTVQTIEVVASVHTLLTLLPLL